MTTPAPRRLPQAALPADGVGDELREATSHDLVFAVVGHAGAGASHVALSLIAGLKSSPYVAEYVKVSSLIADAALGLDPDQFANVGSASRLERARALQDAGNWLRKNQYPSFTAALAIKRLHDIRASRDPERPIAFVLDSLKNPEEVDALRKVYGRSFYLVSVVCSPSVREKRLDLKFKGSPDGEIPSLMNRDEADDATTGQQVRRTIHAADFFVNNHDSPSSETDPVADALSRFLQIVSGTAVVRPTRDERGMYAAWGAGLRSSCLSRQVGVAILDAKGDLIATGTNDVPRAGGGLYQDGDSIDRRCFNYPKPDLGEDSGYCRSDKSKEQIFREVLGSLKDAGVLAENVDETAVHAALRSTALSDLIEFSRAVHAEMDALISLARTGAGGSREATLYSTTYPCHGCAKHIVAAGISEVVYYEPYPKSRALALHDDSIQEDTRAGLTPRAPVHFRLFTGVAPRRFSALFEKRRDLKRGGRLQTAPEGTHADPIFKKAYLEFEKSIADDVVLRTAHGATR